MHYVYSLWNRKNKTSYVGYTRDIEQRVRQHRSTSNFELVYYEAYQYEKDARDRERKLKMYGSAWRGLRQRLKTSLK